MSASATISHSTTTPKSKAGARKGRVGSANKHNAKSTKRPFFAVRSVLGVINKLTGMPVASLQAGGETPANLPINQAIMVVGSLGSDCQQEDRGEIRGRIALYDFQNGQNPRFRFVVEIDANGNPRFDLDRLASRMSGTGDMAAVNWALGALCSDSEPGLYTVNDGFEIPRNSRSLFSSERSWQSAKEMFDTHMKQEWEMNMPRFSIPSIQPMVHESRLADTGDRSRCLLAITREEFRAHAVNHLMQSIANCAPDSRNRMRAEFVYKFATLDRLFSATAGHSVPTGAVAEIQAWLTRLPDMVACAHTKAGATQTEESKRSVAHASDWLARYAAAKGAETFRFWIPSASLSFEPQAGVELNSAFQQPDSRSVSALPLQISAGWDFDGEFPGNGSDL